MTLSQDFRAQDFRERGRSTRVLFVCTGNICRSPTAEVVFRHKAQAAGLDVAVDSAGLARYHIGLPPDTRSREAALRRGYDMSALRARQVTPDDFERFDWLIAMDRGHFQDLRRLAPAGAADRIRMMTDFARCAPAGSDVPDPYYGGAAGFEDVLDLLEDSCDGFVVFLKDA